MRTVDWLAVLSAQVWACCQSSPLPRPLKGTPPAFGALPPSVKSPNTPDAPVAGASDWTQAEPHTVWLGLVAAPTS